MMRNQLMRNGTMRPFFALAALLLAFGLGLAGTRVQAQEGAPGGNPYAPVILVNDLGITGYEISQRMRFMQLLRETGDLRAAAEKSLIEDRLRIWQARADGIALGAEAVAQGMSEFAGRANMGTEDFLKALAQEGVEAQTFRDFVTAGMLWREVVKAHFAGRVQISQADIDRAMALEASRGAGTRVLISEIVIPAPPGQEGAAMAAARRASAAGGEGAFGAIAREVSASASASKGGRLDWMPIENLPPALRNVILGLRPGQATAPVSMPNAVAVFMLRGLDDGGPVSPADQSLGYATLLLGASGAPETAALAARVAADARRCDDLYSVAKALPPERLERFEAAGQSGIAQDVALTLAQLDIGETALLRRGANDLLVMLCSRERRLDEAAGEVAPEAAQIREQLLNARLGSLADGMLADLTAKAVIVRP